MSNYSYGNDGWNEFGVSNGSSSAPKAVNDRRTANDIARGEKWAMSSVGGLSWWMYVVAYPVLMLVVWFALASTSSSASPFGLLSNLLSVLGTMVLPMVFIPAVIIFVVSLIGIIRRRGRAWAIWAFVLNLILPPLGGLVFIAQWFTTVTVLFGLVLGGAMSANSDEPSDAENNARTDLSNIAYAQEFHLANVGEYAASIEELISLAEDADAAGDAGGYTPILNLSSDVESYMSVDERKTAYIVVAVSSEDKVYLRTSESGVVVVYDSVEEYQHADSPLSGVPLPVLD